jgi:hypothetical protein
LIKVVKLFILFWAIAAGKVLLAQGRYVLRPGARGSDG